MELRADVRAHLAGIRRSDIFDPNELGHAELIEQIRDRMERHWCHETIPAAEA